MKIISNTLIFLIAIVLLFVIDYCTGSEHKELSVIIEKHYAPSTSGFTSNGDYYSTNAEYIFLVRNTKGEVKELTVDKQQYFKYETKKMLVVEYIIGGFIGIKYKGQIKTD